MIREHAFNTRWWGEQVAIVDDVAWFALPERERDALLAPFSWAEFRHRIDPSLPLDAIARAGFFHADTQLHFRLGLAHPAPLPNLDSLEVTSAAEDPFQIGAEEMASFGHERFLLIPGSSPARVNQRIAMWCRELVEAHPAQALRLRTGGQVQGWFVSAPEAGALRLALAMLHRDARVSGFSLYAQAVRAYAATGARVGFASFSVANAAVHNIYARLGARFLQPEGCWLWVRR
jgi:hypothetical protein